jgi:flagellar biosynthesis protein FlhF
MGVKTYQAFTMAEALAVAKRDLGPDAVILETRTFKRGGMLGVGRKTIFELTATSSDRADVTPAASVTGLPRAAARAYADQSDFDRTRRLAQALAVSHAKRNQDPFSTARPRRGETPPSKKEPGSFSPPASKRDTAPVARRFILTPADRKRVAARRPAAAVAAATATTLQVPEPAVMEQELAAIKTMVGQVLQHQSRPGTAPRPDMPQNLFDMYLELIGQDLSDELADRIVNAVRGELRDEQCGDGALVRETMLRHLAELVPAADAALPRRSPDDRPLTIALIGPTGVGKTTTLAKLAASFKLRQHRKVGLVTCDTYRIAAVDQLRTYANIIGLPLEVALTPSEMGQAVHALRDCDVVLIDTAGRGPNDRGRLEELHSCLDAAAPHEVHLVLSSTSGQRVLLREAEAFAELGADRVVFTKLDEAVSFGVLINVMQTVGSKLSFITTGQEVPDHIEPGRPERLAELVLGGDVHA